MSETGTEALVRMANQIAANYVALPHDQAAAAVAKHLRSFWAPSMRDDIRAYVATGGAGLSDVATTAIIQLAA
jgi:formate dehydrogenase subunit delta